MDPFLYGDHVAAPTDPSVVTSSRGARRDVDAHGAHAGRAIDGRYFCQSLRANVDAARARRMNATGSARSSREDDALTRRSTAMGRRARDEDVGSTGVGGNCFFMGSVFVHRFDARLTMGATGARDGDARREARRASRVGATRVVSRRVRSVACARSNRKLCSFVRARIRRRDAGSACPTLTRVARWRTRCARRWGREDWINSCETNAGTPPFRTTVRPL